MGKQRVFRKLGDAVPVEHPEGGTFYIKPMSFDDAMRYAELTTRTDFERDKDGKVLFDPKGRPVRKHAGDPRELIDFAAGFLDRVGDTTMENGEPFDMTPDNVRDLLTMMGTDDVEFEVPVDAEDKELAADADPKLKAGTKKVKRPVKENLFLWVTRKSAELAGQRNEIAAKN